MLGDFNVLAKWHPTNCFYYNKIKGNLICAASCFLGLNQHNSSLPNRALLDLVLRNINDLGICVSISDYSHDRVDLVV
jgi:hypothetical protein